MRAKRNRGPKATCRGLNSFVGRLVLKLHMFLCSSGIQMQPGTMFGRNIMKTKNSKKLSLTKETLKILSASDLARVQGAYPTLDTGFVEYGFGTGSNSL